MSGKELEDARKLKEDLSRTLSHRRLGDEKRVQRSLSGWEFRINSLDKEINTLIALNNPANDEKIAQLRNDKCSAEVRCAEVRTLMPTLENTLSERVRDTEDRIDSLSSAVAYHEKTIQELMREMEALPAVSMAANNDSGESVEALALKREAAQLRNHQGQLSRSYQKIMFLQEQEKSKDRQIKQLAAELTDKNRIIESLNNMLKDKPVVK